MYTIDTTTETINSTGGIAIIGKIAEKNTTIYNTQ